MSTRGLILGGGGVTGIAWTIGALLGLHERGVALLRADRIIGTSAGSTVGAQITSGVEFSELFEHQVDPAKQSKELDPQPQQLQSLATTLVPLMSITDAAERIRRIAKFALESKTIDELERRKVIEGRLFKHQWSDCPLTIVALDTKTGDTSLFDRHSGVSIVDAVSASCAVPGIWPPVTINGNRYMDGGVRSPDNADLADDCKILLIVSPTGQGGNPTLAKQIDAHLKLGVGVRVIEPDAASRSAIGLNPFDPQKRAPAAHAGRLQGHAWADELAAFWDSQT
jgi:NTE family protein